MTPQEILETEKVQNWLKYLTDYPEKQGYCMLGLVDRETKEIVQACCLGAYIYTAKCKTLSFSPSRLRDEESRLAIVDEYSVVHLASSYMELHLRSAGGMLSETITIPLLHEYFPAWEASDDNTLPESLADLNDQGGTWPQIAKFINDHPERVFVHYKKT